MRSRFVRMKKLLSFSLFVLLPAALALIFAYCFLTSSFFLTAEVLPFLSGRTGIEIAAEQVELSVFRSRIRVKNLRIGAKENPIVQAAWAEGAFHWDSLLKGAPKLEDVTLDGAELTLYHTVSGNWSAISHAGDTESPLPETPANAPEETRKPFQIDLRCLTVRNATLRLVFGKPGAESSFALAGLDFTADRLANGEMLHLEGSGSPRLSSRQASHINKGKAAFAFEAKLGETLMPESFRAECRFSGLAGSICGDPFRDGAMEIAFHGRHKDGRLTLEKLTLTQSQGGELQSEVDLSGEINYQPFELRADIDARRLSEELTSLLFDLGFGFSPGRAVLQCRGSFSYAKRRLSANGTLQAERRGDAVFGTERLALPPMQLKGEYDVAVDLEASSIDLRNFALILNEMESESASFRLRRPIRYSWKEGATPNDQRAIFDFECNALDLKLLRFLIPADSAFQLDSGYVSSRIQLTFRHNLSLVSLLGVGRINNGSCIWNGRKFELAELLLGIDADIRRNLHWNVRNLSLALKSNSDDLGGANLSGEGELLRPSGTLSGRLERLAPELAIWLMPVLEPLLPEYRKLKLGAAEVSFSLEKAQGNTPVLLKQLTARLDRDGQPILLFNAAPFRFGEVNGKLPEAFTFQLSGALPAQAFNEYFGETLRFDAGVAKLSANGSLTNGFRSAACSGEIFFDEFTATVHGKSDRNFSLQCAFSCEMPNLQTLNFRTLNFYLRHAGKPAMRLECPGSWDLEQKSYAGEWVLRYLNEQFLALFGFAQLSEARLTGKLQFGARENFEVLKLSGGLDLEKLVLPSTGKAISGNLSLNLERDERRLLLRQLNAGLKQEGNPLLDLEGECRVDLTSPEGMVTARINAPSIDASTLLAMIPDSPETPEDAVREPPRLDFGRRPIDLRFRLSQLRLAPNLTAELDTRLRLRGGSISTDLLLLQLNNARYDGEFRGMNTPRGIAFSSMLRGSEPLSLPPLVELLVGSSQAGASGTLQDLNLAVRFLEDGRTNAWLDTLSGSLEMKLRDMVIPNTVANGPFGKLLLFPLEMAGQLNSLLPEDLASWQESVIQSASLKRQLRKVELSEGRVKLHANDGQVQIDECAFFGDWVSRLAFSGRFDLAGEQRLRLMSLLTVGGIQATIPIEGTLESPEVRLEATAAASLSSLLRKIRELNLIGTSAAPGETNKSEPVILLDKLPSAGTLRKLQNLFKGLWNI